MHGRWTTIACCSLVAVMVSGLAIGHIQAARFDGEAFVTRFQFATVLERLLHRCRRIPGTLLTGPNHYTDVPETYASAVSAVSKPGIMVGRDQTFQGKRKMTRYEVAQTLQRLLHKVAISPAAVNAPLLPEDIPPRHPARAAAEELIRHRVMRTYDGKFHGRMFVSRYEFSSIMARVARLLELPSHDVPVTFDDVPRRHWAFEDIVQCCATGLLHIEGVSDEKPPATTVDEEDEKEIVHPTPLGEDVELELMPLDVEMVYEPPAEDLPVAQERRTLN